MRGTRAKQLRREATLMATNAYLNAQGTMGARSINAFANRIYKRMKKLWRKVNAHMP